jgi:hypothetical protein
MGYPSSRMDALDPTLHPALVEFVAHAQVVQPLGLGPTDVTGRGIALRLRVGLVPDERFPMLITRPFDRISNVLPGD